MSEKLDVILMSKDVYTLFIKEMEALDINPKDSGFEKEYRFNGVFCQWASIKHNQVRFISESKCITRNIDLQEYGLMFFLKIHSNAMKAALKELVENECLTKFKKSRKPRILDKKPI